MFRYLLSRRDYFMPACFCFLLLGVAFGMQWLLKLQPCDLCVWGRWAYLSVGVGFLLPLWKPLLQRSWVLWIPGLFSMAGVVLSAIHSLVERKVVTLKLSCMQKKIQGASVDQLRQLLQDQEVVRCDKIEWSLWGVTLPNINILIFGALMMWALYLWKGRCRHA